MDDSGAFEAWTAEAIARRWPRAREEKKSKKINKKDKNNERKEKEKNKDSRIS